MRGRAEFIRLVLAAANRSYDDIRLERSEWPEYKSKMVSDQIPVLKFHDGSMQLPQSITIARYSAHESGLAGRDNLESAKIDAIVDTQRDFTEMFYVKHCENLAKLKDAYSKNNKYFVGDQLSSADLFVYDSIEYLLRFLPQVKDKNI